MSTKYFKKDIDKIMQVKDLLDSMSIQAHESAHNEIRESIYTLLRYWADCMYEDTTPDDLERLVNKAHMRIHTYMCINS